MIVLEVNAESPGDAQKALRERPDIVSVTQLGIRLRILVADDHEDPQELVRSRLSECGVQADVRIIAPSLEDVFVANTRKPGGAEK